jgi:hypothetical protein
MFGDITTVITVNTTDITDITMTTTVDANNISTTTYTTDRDNLVQDRDRTHADAVEVVEVMSHPEEWKGIILDETPKVQF